MYNTCIVTHTYIYSQKYTSPLLIDFEEKQLLRFIFSWHKLYLKQKSKMFIKLFIKQRFLGNMLKLKMINFNAYFTLV